MKSTSCFLTACIVCGVLPLMVQGAELLEDHPSKKPKVQVRRIFPVVIEIESGVINLSFTRDLDEVTIELQQTTSISVFKRTVNTSIQNGESFHVCPGTYILSVTTVDGIILIEEVIVIP